MTLHEQKLPEEVRWPSLVRGLKISATRVHLPSTVGVPACNILAACFQDHTLDQPVEDKGVGRQTQHLLPMQLHVCAHTLGGSVVVDELPGPFPVL